jgi:Ca-activated chloride channel homolog
MTREVLNDYISLITHLEFLDRDIWYVAIVFGICLLYIVFLRVRGLLSLFIRLALVLALISAAALPYKSTTSFLDSTHKIFLLDISKSMSDEALHDCITKAGKITGTRKTKLYPFDNKILKPLEMIPGQEDDLHKKILSRRSESLTNFEESLRQLSTYGQSEDVLLCSDGRETAGNILQVISELRRKSIKVHPFFPDNRLLQPDEVIITSFTGPFIIEYGQAAQFTASIRNPTNSPFTGSVTFSVDGKTKFEKDLSINPSREITISEFFRELPTGVHKITFSVSGEDERSRWVEVKERPRVLLLHGKQNESNLTENLLKTLGYERESLIAGKDTLPDSLSSYTGVILNNVPENKLPREFQEKLKEHVQKGSGLLILGGDASFGLGGYSGSILDELSPLQSVPPRTKVQKLPSAVALVIDKSGSMRVEGRMMAARLAALNTINGLSDEDYVMVVGFDHAPLVVMDLEKVATARRQAEMRLRNLTADGGTNLLPALSRARYRLARASAGKKHIIILTDGIFPHTGNQFANEVNTIKREGITMSTIALGLDADVPFMRLLAQQGGGRFYQVLNAQVLPKVFLEDLKVRIGEDTMKEQSDFPVLPGPAGIVSSSVRHFPFLKGFVETKAKDRAQVELMTRKENDQYPIFANWISGTGRVYAFASDLVGRWSSSWLRWPQIGNFWDDIFKKLRGTQDSTNENIRFDLRYHVQGSRLYFELFVYEKELGQVRSGTAELRSKNDSKQSFTFKRREAGRYEGSLDLQDAGDYILSTILDTTPLPPVGISISAHELGEVRGQGVDTAFLNRLARDTSGVVNPSGEDLSTREAREITTPELYTLPFVILTVILLIVEVFIRERRRV